MVCEPEDGTAIMVCALGPSGDLIEIQRIEDPVALARRILQLPRGEDPPVRNERMRSVHRDHSFSRFDG
jgi:hypothetical protein